MRFAATTVSACARTATRPRRLTWPSSVAQIAREEGLKGLQSLPASQAISGKLVELLERGSFDAWERLKEETPETAIGLLKVEGAA